VDAVLAVAVAPSGPILWHVGWPEMGAPEKSVAVEAAEPIEAARRARVCGSSRIPIPRPGPVASQQSLGVPEFRLTSHKWTT
jgi:hypothetical protein